MSEFLLPGSPAAYVVDRPSTDANQLRECRGREGRGADESDVGVGELREAGAMDVLGRSHGFEVFGANAGKDSAEMVDLVARGDGTDELLVRGSMCKLRPAADAQAAVTVGQGLPDANPARGRVTALFLPPKIGRNRMSLSDVGDVPAHESDALPCCVPDPSVRLLGDRRVLSAAALANPTGVQGRKDRAASAPHAMATHVLAVADSDSFRNGKHLAAPAFAEHGRMMTKASEATRV